QVGADTAQAGRDQGDDQGAHQQHGRAGAAPVRRGMGRAGRRRPAGAHRERTRRRRRPTRPAGTDRSTEATTATGATLPTLPTRPTRPAERAGALIGRAAEERPLPCRPSVLPEPRLPTGVGEPAGTTRVGETRPLTTGTCGVHEARALTAGSGRVREARALPAGGTRVHATRPPIAGGARTGEAAGAGLLTGRAVLEAATVGAAGWGEVRPLGTVGGRGG